MRVHNYEYLAATTTHRLLFACPKKHGHERSSSSVDACLHMARPAPGSLGSTISSPPLPSKTAGWSSDQRSLITHHH
jgi:hypothetical protein